MLHFYDVGLRWVLRNRLLTLFVAIATLVLTIYLYLFVPKGLLPQQDTGEIIGVTDAAQNISFKAMLDNQREVSDIVEKDPDVLSVAGFDAIPRSHPLPRLSVAAAAAAPIKAGCLLP
jgi:multidrug efflux pump subunit AcrB